MKRLPLKGPLLLSLVLHLILLFAVGLMAGRRTIQKPRLLIGVKLMEPGRGTEGHDSSAGGSKEALEHSLSSLTASMLEEGPVKDDASPDKPRKASHGILHREWVRWWKKGTHGIRGRYWKRNGNRRRQR